ncbi:MAG: glutamate racemase [Bacteroidota bacterium]|nr:glutamate racemase [Bacteroidota bacterium]
MQYSPIGVFDSGYGGLSVLTEIVNTLPEYDYVYLGDNARTPYGTRSFDVVYQFTLESVKKLFSMGCELVILACNTASAKALRSIQQRDLPGIDPCRRVLGVIRPSIEVIGHYTQTNKIGILGTPGTVISNSYPLEIKKLFPDVDVFQQACPMWVPLVENNEHLNPGADYFVKLYIDALLQQNEQIDTVILGCTHYPLLATKIRQYLPEKIQMISQGPIVAESLKDYLYRHPEMDVRCSKNGTRNFYTTDSTEIFDRQASIFFGSEVRSQHLTLP